MRHFAFALAIFSSALLGACATQLPAPTQTFENVSRLRQDSVPPLALGEFTRGPELSEQRDRSISIRADSLQPPSGGTFSGYLRSTIESELAGAGKLDPASPFLLSGQLTRSEVSTGGSQSRATIAALFRVTRSGAVVYERELTVGDEWPSTFLGAIAIPEAMNHYTGLYPKAFGALLADPAFLAAVR